MEDLTSSDSLIHKSIRLNGKVWTISSAFEGISYHYLVNQEDDETIIRADSLLHAEIYRFGGAVDPN